MEMTRQSLFLLQRCRMIHQCQHQRRSRAHKTCLLISLQHRILLLLLLPSPPMGSQTVRSLLQSILLSFSGRSFRNQLLSSGSSDSSCCSIRATSAHRLSLPKILPQKLGRPLRRRKLTDRYQDGIQGKTRPRSTVLWQ